jgi:uncharacterized protein YheU (UPF0270 family)
MRYASYVVPIGTVYNTLSVSYDEKRHIGDTILPETVWEQRVSNLLKAELKRKGVTYGHLAKRLAEIGVDEKEANIKNKLSRGKFSAVFLLQCLQAIGAERLTISV